MAFSWSEYRLFMGGRFVTGVRGFKYKKSREIEAIYAEGDEPADEGFGNKAYEGEITILQNELEAIIASSPGNDPFSLPAITIVHSYTPKNKPGGKIVVDVCQRVYFKEIEKAMEQGKTFMEITTPMYVGSIRYNTVSPF
ncbi:hypothetical protein [Dysgonomonas sp. ZJ279]|uniref:hypothetical protein n=1 Tax=Dysgonomonas sp. ZJ279 TaxID=2709796 RepID=UPI0013ED52B3|nr:hypothetical protein [Dysgonomonas sp. ZJ279]